MYSFRTHEASQGLGILRVGAGEDGRRGGREAEQGGGWGRLSGVRVEGGRGGRDLLSNVPLFCVYIKCLQIVLQTLPVLATSKLSINRDGWKERERRGGR